jgi:hypothetical protein
MSSKSGRYAEPKTAVCGFAAEIRQDKFKRRIVWKVIPNHSICPSTILIGRGARFPKNNWKITGVKTITETITEVSVKPNALEPEPIDFFFKD